jgi:hypothetical protein
MMSPSGHRRRGRRSCTLTTNEQAPDGQAERAASWQTIVCQDAMCHRVCGQNVKEQIVDGLTVPLAVVTSRTEAELIAGLLRSNGLRAAVSADDAGGQDPQLQLEGVRVLVAAADEAAARRILAEAEAAGS